MAAHVLADVKSRLEVCLTGDEPILQAQAVVRSVLEDRFSVAEAMLDAAQATADEHWRREVEAALVLATVAGLVGLSLRYPSKRWRSLTGSNGPSVLRLRLKPTRRTQRRQR